MPNLEMKQQIAVKIADYLGHPEITADKLSREMTTPPNMGLGYIAQPCFSLAKLLGKSSKEIADELAKMLQEAGFEATPTGPYVNVKWALDPFLKEIWENISRRKDKYGSDRSGEGQKILIEYCSPNIAKKLAFHHIRSTLIGNVLGNLYRFLGYETIRMNFVGDWGSQFARLLAAYELWGKPEDLNADDIEHSMTKLGEIYVKFHKQLDDHPEYLEAASQCLAKLERKEEKTWALWEQVKAISVSAMNKTLSRMHIEFDLIEGESDYIDRIDQTLTEVKEKANAKQSEGAWIVEVPDFETPALVQKTDGTTLYLTRDIAAAADRHKRFKFDKMYYVVAAQQKLHFQLLFGVLKKMGLEWADNCVHLPFGIVLFGSGKMSTREGNVILLDNLLDEARDRALKLCSEKNPDLPNKEKIAEQVGVGAVIFGELSSHIQRDINFSWDHLISFEGETGPYVQYAVVRCHSLLSKADSVSFDGQIEVPPDYEFSTEEEALILALSKFRAVLHTAVSENEPYHLPRYLIEVARAFSRFYNNHPVLQATNALHRTLRLKLVLATRQVLQNGLNLLGIETPEEM